MGRPVLPQLLGLVGVILAHSLREDGTFFPLMRQSCLLNRKRREGDRKGREGDGDCNSAFRGHWSYLAGISKPQNAFPTFLWFKPKALAAYLLQMRSLNGAAPTAACEAVAFSFPVATSTQLRLQ